MCIRGSAPCSLPCALPVAHALRPTARRRACAFDKDESLARTFAAKGLASGEFAMGYYCEVGIGGGSSGGGKELGEARGWYAKAAAHGNTDAAERLRALALAVPQALTLGAHYRLRGPQIISKLKANLGFTDHLLPICGGRKY
ncbi:hypothetical protein C8F04DRAFT_1197751 [Mycena alexandri]|uniref:Sel1 repeat family protein n=1 Tax=Mycena alexandri TaxID=1745969 RepID=A0AAD6WPZ1_9AGAR|nr:hypothetical protein C8F04DRAFT_1197751 [Mycena alexandri]